MWNWYKVKLSEHWFIFISLVWPGRDNYILWTSWCHCHCSYWVILSGSGPSHCLLYRNATISNLEFAPDKKLSFRSPDWPVAAPEHVFPLPLPTKEHGRGSKCSSLHRLCCDLLQLSFHLLSFHLLQTVAELLGVQPGLAGHSTDVLDCVDIQVFAPGPQPEPPDDGLNGVRIILIIMHIRIVGNNVDITLSTAVMNLCCCREPITPIKLMGSSFILKGMLKNLRGVVIG